METRSNKIEIVFCCEVVEKNYFVYSSSVYRKKTALKKGYRMCE